MIGQVPPKSFLPSSPYGASPAANALNPTQPAAQNAQVPLLPPNFQDPGTMQSNLFSAGTQTQNPFGTQPRQTGGGWDTIQKIFKMATLLLLFLPFSARATTTVTGTLQNLGTGTVGQGAFVRFWLRGCGGNQPRVNGTAVIAPSQGGVFFFDLIANSSGVISGTLYSTRDVTGNNGGDITCGTSTTSVWYGMQVFVGGKGGPEIPVHAKNTGTLDISSVTPITTTPVVTSPNGDSTYARLDGGNQPFTGVLKLPSGSSASPSYGFTNAAGQGMYYNANVLATVFADAGNEALGILPGVIMLSQNGGAGFYQQSGGLFSGTRDTGFSRPAAGVFCIDTTAVNNCLGSIKAAGLVSSGAQASLTGTGACATFSTQSGGSWAGRATCTGTTGASTLTITPGTTAPNGWICYVQDQTTRANLLQQTSNSPTSCTLTATSVTQNDVFVFTAVAF